jgi:hypothetical protein
VLRLVDATGLACEPSRLWADLAPDHREFIGVRRAGRAPPSSRFGPRAPKTPHHSWPPRSLKFRTHPTSTCPSRLPAATAACPPPRGHGKNPLDFLELGVINISARSFGRISLRVVDGSRR